MAVDFEKEAEGKYSPCTRAEINSYRGIALNQFIHLERESATSFGFAVGSQTKGSTDHKKTQVAQFAYSQLIKNGHAHRKVLKKIAKVHLPEDYNQFVNSLIRAFEKASGTRNAIAHNQTGSFVGRDGALRHFICNNDGNLDATSLFVEDLKTYIRELKFLLYAMVVFRSAVVGEKPDWISDDLYIATLHTAIRVPPDPDDPLVKAGFW